MKKTPEKFNFVPIPAMRNVAAGISCMAMIGLASGATSVTLYDLPWAQNPGAWQSNDTKFMAQTFTTGTATLDLSSVEIWIRNAAEADDDSIAGKLDINLYATDGSFKPTGSSLYSITSNMAINAWYDNGSGVGQGTDFTGLNYSLSADTTYAIVFSSTPNSGAYTTIGWKYNTDASTPTSGISPTPTFYNWESTNGTAWTGADPVNGFSMNVTAVVPEPSTLALVGIGTLAVFTSRRRTTNRS